MLSLIFFSYLFHTPQTYPIPITCVYNNCTSRMVCLCGSLSSPLYDVLCFGNPAKSCSSSSSLTADDDDDGYSSICGVKDLSVLLTRLRRDGARWKDFTSFPPNSNPLPQVWVGGGYAKLACRFYGFCFCTWFYSSWETDSDLFPESSHTRSYLALPRHFLPLWPPRPKGVGGCLSVTPAAAFAYDNNRTTVRV